MIFNDQKYICINITTWYCSVCRRNLWWIRASNWWRWTGYRARTTLGWWRGNSRSRHLNIRLDGSSFSSLTTSLTASERSDQRRICCFKKLRSCREKRWSLNADNRSRSCRQCHKLFWIWKKQHQHSILCFFFLNLFKKISFCVL